MAIDAYQDTKNRRKEVIVVEIMARYTIMDTMHNTVLYLKHV